MNLDASAILNILSKAECFPDSIKKQSVIVRDNVRNKWAHAILSDWTVYKLNNAFLELVTLAKLMPNNAELLAELDKDLKGFKAYVFPMKNFLMKVNKFRISVLNGEHKKIQDKIRRLENIQGKEIYLERTFEETSTGKILSSIEHLVLDEEVTLLKGEAGGGKSSVVTKAVQRWAEGNHMLGFTCCLFLAAGSEEKIPLYKIIWDEYTDVRKWSENEAKETFQHLQNLADEGKLAIIIDGLDELGMMTAKDALNASRAANHSPLEVDMKTACVGILNKTILPGARVLATGRNTELVNKEILQSKASMKELIKLTANDRGRMIEMMESDPNEKQRIQNELDRVSTAGNDYFVRTPLMIKILIALVIDKMVDIREVNNSSDIYLMVLMANLDFHTNQNTNFTELDPPEYHEYLVSCMKLCQMKMQSEAKTTCVQLISTIRGIQKNVRNLGQCFEARALGETICIPVDFIKKLGIFEYKKDGGAAYLDAVHLSFIEFGCAASICQKGVNIQQELSKIDDKARFKAVVVYMAGIFATNSHIGFLNVCKNLCHNFVHLLENQEQDKSVQDIFSSIRSSSLFMKENGDIQVSTMMGLNIVSGEERTALLIEAMVASKTKLDINRIMQEPGTQSRPQVAYPYLSRQLWTMFSHSVPNLRDLPSRLVRQPRSLRSRPDAGADKVDSTGSKFNSNEEHIKVNMRYSRGVTRASKNLSVIQFFKFQEIQDIEVQIENIRIRDLLDQIHIIALLQLSKTWKLIPGAFGIEFNGSKMDSLQSNKFEANKEVALVELCELLRKVNKWRLDELILNSASSEDWEALAEASTRGTIGTVVILNECLVQANSDQIQAVWDSTETEWVWKEGSARKTEGVAGLNKLLSVRDEKSYPEKEKKSLCDCHRKSAK